jgi:hypothetical protein
MDYGGGDLREPKSSGLSAGLRHHHSTFSKNRHGRFQDSKIFEELFEYIVLAAFLCLLCLETDPQIGAQLNA